MTVHASTLDMEKLRKVRALMQGGKWRRAGFNPFLIGY